MKDNARPHTTMCVTLCLAEVGRNKTNCPACLLDLNPIDHVCDMLAKRVRGIHIAPVTVNELRLGLQKEWQIITQDAVQKVIGSINRRLLAVSIARGCNTKH